MWFLKLLPLLRRLIPREAEPATDEPGAPTGKRIRPAWVFWTIQTVVAILIGAGGAYFGCSLGTPTLPPMPDEPIFAMGWVADHEAIAQASAALPKFSETPAGRAVMGEEPRAVYLWQAVEKATGKPCPIHDQNPVGSCVSFGTSRAFEKSLAVQITLGDRYEWTPLVEEAVYGGSRVEVGGGRITGDGSIGAWAARWVKDWGGLPRGTYTAGGKTYDLTRYDPGRCRDWGRRGVPDDLEPEAKKYPAGDAAKVSSWGEAKKALAQGYGIAICSDQGFSFTRDSRGVAKPQGTWAHCMCLDGYHVDEAGREFGHIENSWGPDIHKGPVGWGSPPTSGFWADAATINRMLSQGDSWAFSAVKGFPARRIDWFALRPGNGKPSALAIITPFIGR